MVTPNVKRLAYATMDHAVAFELHVSTTPPDGEYVVELARGRAVDDVLPIARFVSQMARTFFHAKLIGRVTTVQPDQEVAVFVVVELPELVEFDLLPDTP